MAKAVQFPPHRVRALAKMLVDLEIVINRRSAFIERYGEVYKMHSRVIRRQIAQYTRLLKAIDELKTLDAVYLG